MDRRRRLVEVAVVAGALGLFAWRELGAMRADGTTVDEPAHLFYGERGLTQGTFGRQSDLLNSKMPVSVLNALPVVAAERLGSSPPDDARRLWLGRLPTVALGLVLGGLVFGWARALFGFGGGALALLLYTCCPNVLAHSHLITTDVATALGMFGATYAFWRWRQRPGPGRLAVAAAVFGAAQLTKITALFLIPIFLLVALLEARRRRPGGLPAASDAGREGGAGATAGADATSRASTSDADATSGAGAGASAAAGADATSGAVAVAGAPRHRLAAAALALAAGALVALNLGFLGENTLAPLSSGLLLSRPFQALASVPVLRDLPLPVPQPYLTGIDMCLRDAHAGSRIYLHGRFSRHGFRDYFLVASLIKLPVGTLALLALALWLAASGRVRAPGAEAFLLVPPAFLLAYFSLAFEMQIGLRFLLPALPFLFVFAGRAAAWRPRAPAAAALPVGLLAAWIAASSLAAHPHYLSYFNELIGGPRNGYRWLSDSNVDWAQDDRYVRQVYARRGPAPVWIEPTGPITGRVAVGVTQLVTTHDWLREHFRPSAVVRGSWAVFDVAEADLRRCCAGMPRAWPLPGLAGDLAYAGQPIGGGDAVVGMHLLERLNDGMLGANTQWDAARTSPPTPGPVQAWFGIAWEQPREIGRVVAYPSFVSRGPGLRQFLATDYVLQWWDGRGWVDLPGTRVTGNRRCPIEHRFPPVRTTRLRLLVEREKNQWGTDAAPDVFRAACLEIAVYAR
jgi:Dolichyl-phosphate-mannose-protein mannosyltransferase